MAGSWEIRQAHSVLVATLHTDVVTLAWAYGIRNLQVPGEVIGVSGMPYDMARNSCCNMVLKNGFEWCFFLDSDVIPPRDAILRLLARNKPVISGVYHRRSPPAGVPVMQKPIGNWVTRYPPNAVIEVDVVGAGCLLIHRSVLERLPPQDREHGKHWFNWCVDKIGIKPREECLSEDYSFCMAVKRHLGIPILVDTSVQCKHVGFFQVTHNNAQPLECAPVT